jgi:hypothetical protein
MDIKEAPYVCGIEIEGLYEYSDFRYNAIHDEFKSNGVSLQEYGGDVGSSHFSFGYDGSVEAYGRHRLNRHLRDFEFRTPPFAVTPNRFPVPRHIMKGISLFKQTAHPIVSHICGLHVHISGRGVSVETGKTKFLHELQDRFVKYYVHKHRKNYCKTMDCRSDRYCPVRNVGKWHYEVRVFNATFNERAIQTAVFDCLHNVLEVKRKMRAERAEKNAKKDLTVE